MSIEQSLERIAVALEELVFKKRDEQAKAAQPIVPETPVAPTATPAVTLDAITVQDAKGLRDFAQKYVAKAGEKTQALVTFIKNDVCTKFAPTDPKLVNIPADKVKEAAQMIYNWAFKNNIIV